MFLTIGSIPLEHAPPRGNWVFILNIMARLRTGCLRLPSLQLYKTECTSSKVFFHRTRYTREMRLEFAFSSVATPVKFTLPSDFDPPNYASILFTKIGKKKLNGSVSPQNLQKRRQKRPSLAIDHPNPQNGSGFLNL